MPYPKEHPMNVLSVARNASKEDLVRALLEAGRVRPEQMAKLRQAFIELSEPAKRLECEILLADGNAELEKTLGELLAGLRVKGYIPSDCPDLPLPGVGGILDQMDFPKEFGVQSLPPCELGLSNRYDGAVRMQLPIFFHR